MDGDQQTARARDLALELADGLEELITLLDEMAVAANPAPDWPTYGLLGARLELRDIASNYGEARAR
jgi:hypothetical protein